LRAKGLAVILAVTLLLAQGCGMLDGIGQTVNFATETTTYMNELKTFGEDMNGLAEKAVADIDARTDLKARIVELKDQVVAYGNLTVPDYAKDLHASIAQYNDTLQQGLDQALTNIEQGRAAFDATGIPDTIGKVNELLTQLNGLAP
jgi:polyhydroxyalkanoate synthesis regulator phasin